ncbi:MAG: LysR family transcriptional regulator, partial [Lachnospiraceae bacterium]|nr:LysR family transcriptional regulator [Lachnospiraceae bacterium]
MEWNQLQKFLAVAREENMSKAAELLDTSQPSLSQTIKR